MVGGNRKKTGIFFIVRQKNARINRIFFLTQKGVDKWAWFCYTIIRQLNGTGHEPTAKLS
jgi:hypothetical protein